MNDGIVENDVYMGIFAYESDLVINGGEIKVKGDAVILFGYESPSTLEFNGGTISRIDSGVPDFAAALYIDSSSSAEINGGEINSIDTGVKNNGSLTIEEGTISGVSTGISNSVTLTISGGSISGGTTGISNSGTLTISGGSISGGTTGIINTSGGTVVMNGGKVTGTWLYGIEVVQGELVMNGGEIEGHLFLQKISAEIIFHHNERFFGRNYFGVGICANERKNICRMVGLHMLHD